jgi:hypothetical protein
MSSLILVLLMFGAYDFSFAHEGHHHGSEDQIPSAPHGGNLKQKKELFVELVVVDKQIKVYLLDSHLKSLDSNNLKLTAKMIVPRKNQGPMDLILKKEGEYFTSKLPDEASHRYELKLYIENGKDKFDFEFNVEP